MNYHNFDRRTWQVLCVVGIFLILALGPSSHITVGVTGEASIATGVDWDSWRRVADLPTARWELATAVVNGKVYAFGGHIEFNQALSTVEEYDPMTDTWRTRAPMPTKRARLGAVAIEGKIYTIAGSNEEIANPIVEEYNPATDTWRIRAPMPTKRVAFAHVAVGGKIYTIGGYGGKTVVEEYDPSTDTWRTCASMPTGRGHPDADVVNGKIYVIGGYDGYTFGTWNEEYDPLTDLWRTRAPMPSGRSDLTVTASGGRIYAFGGQYGIQKPVSTVEEYNPTTNTWQRRAAMSNPRSHISSVVINEKIYVIGGWTGTTALSTVEEYTPPDPTEAPTITGWLAGWDYRKSHAIQGSPAGPQTNYQIRLNMHYGSGVDSRDTVYLQGQGRPDFGDFRFTTSDGQTELDYWIEKKVDGDYALVWVEVPSIPASPETTVIYLYYGNSEASTISNGTETFEFFDDFEDNSLDLNKWANQVGTVMEENGQLVIVDPGAGVAGVTVSVGGTAKNWSQSFRLGFSMELQNVVGWPNLVRWYIQGDTPNTPRPGNFGYMLYTCSASNGLNTLLRKYNGAWTNLVEWRTHLFDGVVHNIEITHDVSSGQMRSTIDGVLRLSATDTEYTSGYLQFTNDKNANTDVSYGYVYVAQYLSAEPTHDSWGSEESEFPTIMVESPNGGEALRGAHTITWMAINPQGDSMICTVYYSPNGGQSWTKLDTGLTESSYTWDSTTVVDGANYLIKVEASDGTYTGGDVSDAPFQVANDLISTPSPPNTTVEPGNTAPTVLVIRPNGGEQIKGPYEIRWSAVDPNEDILIYIISYSPNDGQTWTQIASGLTDTSYMWDTSVIQAGENYLINVEASDRSLSAVDRSDAPFTIEHEPTSGTDTDTGVGFIPGFEILEVLSIFLIWYFLRKGKRWMNH